MASILGGEQIRRGKEIVKEIGLSNLELIHGDICEFKVMRNLTTSSLTAFIAG